ncbi:MAG: hypothetical protein F6K26_49740 [Moorea sp. SIO2I5]|nr:hypothetical protein [Moorena sp. SIO2I5]
MLHATFWLMAYGLWLMAYGLWLMASGFGCISFLQFDLVVRYGTHCPNTCYSLRLGELAPNAPYWSDHVKIV